ncbi:MAG: DUF2283 domain-containing protein, partial [Methanobacteriota archaeon]
VFYDRDQDVLYIGFGKVQEADDSELTGNDVVVRYRKGRIIGVTVLGFSKRHHAKKLAGTARVSAAS